MILLIIRVGGLLPQWSCAMCIGIDGERVAAQGRGCTLIETARAGHGHNQDFLLDDGVRRPRGYLKFVAEGNLNRKVGHTAVILEVLCVLSNSGLYTLGLE